METSTKVSRRKFLGATVVAGAATTVSSGEIARGATDAAAPAAESSAKSSALRPSARVAAAETGAPAAAAAQGRAGSDFMVDVIKSLDIDYVPSNPASSFRGLHDSLVNYGENDSPMLLCNHEKIAVQIAHG